MKYYVGDFETITKPPTRVWAWALCDIGTLECEIGNSIETFMETVSRETCRCYFHNLGFDGMFMLDWMLRQGFKQAKKKMVNNTFDTLIGDMGQWYRMKVKMFGNTVTFVDSYKVIPLPVEDIPKAYGLSDAKLTIDYDAYREPGHELTDQEKDYVKEDVIIVAKALRVQLDQGYNKITLSSNAYNDLKGTIEEEWRNVFPPLELSIDADCRKSYKGGWVYCNPEYQGKVVGQGEVYDVNSMYPHVMRDRMLPYGVPEYYVGQYQYDDLYPLYICCVEADIKLKPGKYPSIQLKKSLLFKETEYLTETGGPAIMHLTSVDFELMKENYDILSIRYINGYKFRGAVGLFRNYIDKWYDAKQMASKEGNDSLRTLAKHFLNNAYGKFGTNPIKREKLPYFDEESNRVRFKLSDEQVSNTGYVPVASFITSWARDIIIRSANAAGERFLYADTDSLHVIGKGAPDIDIDPYRLGAFKMEFEFDRAKYLRPKCYIEEGDYTLKKCAGLPRKSKEQLNFDTLHSGAVFTDKFIPKVVPGGVVLEKTTFRIK